MTFMYLDIAGNSGTDNGQYAVLSDNVLIGYVVRGIDGMWWAMKSLNNKNPFGGQKFPSKEEAAAHLKENR